MSHPLAAEAGAKMLEAGGNAIDAAVAIQLALNVVEPEFSGIGGGGFMMIHLKKTGETFVVEGREKAPAAADTSLFVEPSSGCNQNFTVASTSGQAVGVPGTLKVLATALEGWGTKSLAEVIQPAYGSPGGAGIISSVFSVFNVTLNLIDHGMSIEEAVEAPRISVTTTGNSISREAGFDDAEIQKLRDLGHNVGNPTNIGNVNAVVIDLRTGKQYGAVDSTREGGLIGLPRKGE